MLDVLAKHTDQHANIALRAVPKNQPIARQWKEVTIKELKAYIAVYFWLGVYISTQVNDFWNTNPIEGPIRT